MGRTECLCMSVQELGCGEKETQFLSVIVTSYWGVFTDPKVMKESFPSLLFLSMGFSRQEYWSGLPFPTRIFQTQGLNPCLLYLLFTGSENIMNLTILNLIKPSYLI